MSALPSQSPADAAQAYERYISEHWDSLQPFEQEQARAYLQSKFQAMHQPQAQAQMPGFASATQARAHYSSGPAYGMYGGYAPAATDQGGDWAVPVGYLALLLFTPLALFCGIYNITKGRSGHGIAQILLAVAPLVIVLMLVSAA